MKGYFTTITCCLFGFLPQQILAQEEEEPREMFMAGIEVGYGHFPTAALEPFVPAGFNFGPDHFAIGLREHAVHNRFVLGLNIFGFWGAGQSNDSLDVSRSGANVGLDVGYLLLDGRHVKLYPTVGLGGTFYELSVSENRDLSLQEVQQDPGREIRMGHGGYALDFGLNLNVIPKWNLREEEDQYKGFMTGLKVGYLHTFSNSNWNYTGGSVNDGPSFGLQGFYARLTIGFARASRLD